MELPFNRSEVFFTATVLPALLQADDWANLGRFAELAGVVPPNLPDQPTSSTLLMWTEYDYHKARHAKPVAASWEPLPGVGTPDLLLLWNVEPRLLLCVEGKMFNVESALGLNTQVKAQRPLLDLLAHRLDVSPGRSLHVTLLPESLANAVGKPPSTDRLITWEQVRGSLRPDAGEYWHGQLDHALASFAGLQGVKSPTGQYADGKALGLDLVSKPAYANAWMGCAGGVKGLRKLLEDLHAWEDFSFEYNTHCAHAPSRNWFAVATFRHELAKRGLIGSQSHTPDDAY